MRFILVTHFPYLVILNTFSCLLINIENRCYLHVCGFIGDQPTKNNLFFGDQILQRLLDQIMNKYVNIKTKCYYIILKIFKETQTACATPLH